MNLLRRQFSRRMVSRRLKIILALMLLWISSYGAPAFADTQQMSGIMGPFDLTDSHGIHISQFALNINMGNAVTSTWKMMLTPILISSWAMYSWSIGFVGWALDWTMDLSWATYITSAFNSASSAIRGNILSPIGATSYTGGIVSALLAAAALVVVVKMHRQGTASAFTSALWSAVAASLALGVFALPVATFAGGSELASPLKKARALSIETMAAINGTTAPANPETDKLPAELKPSTVLIDSFVRIPHQEYNYGDLIDGTKCQGAYDDALKKGPVEASSDKIRSAVGDCDDKYKDYADHPDFWWLFVQMMFSGTGMGVSAIVAVLLVLTWMAVMQLCWCAFSTTYKALLAIVSAASWAPLVTSIVMIGVSLLQVVAGPMVLAIGLRAVKLLFGAGDAKGNTAIQAGELSVKFLAADLLMLTTTILLLVNYFGNKHWGKKLARKLAAHTPAPSINPGRTVLKTVAGAAISREAFQRFRAHSPNVTRSITNATSHATRTLSNPVVSRGLQVTAGAATGPAGAAAVKSATGAARLAEQYHAIRQGQEAGGLRGNALVLAARGHNVVTSAKNKTLNTLDDKKDTIRTLASGAVPPAHGQTLTTGSERMDSALLRFGRGRRRTEEKIDAGSRVIAGARSDAQRVDKDTTGHAPIDAALTGVGKIQRSADRIHDTATKTRSATPATPRNQQIVVKRPASTTPKRTAPEPTPGAQRSARTGVSGRGTQPRSGSSVPGAGRGDAVSKPERRSA